MIRLCIVQHNFSEDSIQIIFDGLGTIQENEDGMTLTYFEDTEQTSCVVARLENNTLKLNRKNEALSTTLHCIVNELSDIEMVSQYGSFPLQAYTHHIECQGKKLTFMYDVVNGTEVIESYRFDWKWEEKH